MSTSPFKTKNLVNGKAEGSIPGTHDSIENSDHVELTRGSHRQEVSGQTKKLTQDHHDHVIQSPANQPTELTVWRTLEEDLQRKHKILIVYAHWERTSFNGALLDTAVAALTDQGHEVTVSDLYTQGFNPLPSRNDITDGPRNPDRYSHALEAGLAYDRGSLAPDIAEEQAKLARADTVIFQFPLNWATVPAILKGYFDRVLTLKYAFNGQERFDKAKFRGKTAILSLTTGAAETMFRPDGFMGDINIILWPIQNCILRFCGWDVLSPNICFSPAYATDAERVGMLATWKDRLTKDIWSEPLLHFIPIDHFHEVTGRLDDEALGKLLLTPPSSTENGETPQPSKPLRLPIGQHVGRQVSPESMYIPEVSMKTQKGLIKSETPEAKVESREKEG